MKKKVETINEDEFFEALDKVPTLHELTGKFLKEFGANEIPVDRRLEMFNLYNQVYQTHEADENIYCIDCVYRVRFAITYYYKKELEKQ